MTKTITEPSKEIPVVAEPDVVVVGGGPSGYVAAIAAARNGADTLLVERYGCLGGMATGGHVIYIDLVSGKEKQFIFGIPQEILEQSMRLGGYTQRRGRKNPSVDAEVHKLLADRLVLESGAKIRFHSWAVNTIEEKGVTKGVIIESKSGRQAILAKVVIDATGDGDIAAFLGAEYTHGTMPITLINRLGGVDVERAMRFRKENPELYDKFQEELYKMEALLSPNITRKWRIGSGWGPTLRESVIYCHWAQFIERDCTNAEDLTYCEIEGRKKILQALDFFKKNVPGFEKAFALDSCPQMGIRRSRNIIGEYFLTIEDVNKERVFNDNIATCPYSNDTDKFFQIPYRCLVPKKFDNLLIAGRCISDDFETHVIQREIGPCMATGQAAGTAAALVIKEGINPRELIEKVSLLQDVLAEQKVNLEPR